MRIEVDVKKADQSYNLDTGEHVNYLVIEVFGIETRVPCTDEQLMVAIRETALRKGSVANKPVLAEQPVVITEREESFSFEPELFPAATQEHTVATPAVPLFVSPEQQQGQQPGSLLNRRNNTLPEVRRALVKSVPPVGLEPVSDEDRDEDGIRQG